MITRVASKQDTQRMIKALRQAGLTVERLSHGYKCEHPKHGLLFKAMNGSRGYLIRMNENLFTNG